MEIHPATLDDIPQLSELLRFLFTQEDDFEPDFALQSEGLRQIIEHPDIGQILVCHEGASVLGMVNLLFTVSTALGGRVAVLEDLIVHPQQRGRGAGSQLLRAAIDTARASGCPRITLLSGGNNIAAHRFYRGNGFTSSNMVPFRLMLR